MTYADGGSSFLGVVVAMAVPRHVAPGRLVDPSDRFEHRYRSPRAWTEQVTRAGGPGTDPLPGGGSSVG